MTKKQEFRKQTEEAKFEAFSLMCKKVADLEKENAELKNQLEQAKEILQEYIRINLLPPIERNFDDEVKLFKQAEQFLSEVEK